MQSAKFGVLAICAALALSGCSTLDSDKIDYKSASKGVGLEVPPDLNQLSRDSRYTVPGGAVTASNFQVGQAAPAVPTAASTLGDVRIERAGTQRWLVINRSADQLWGPVRDFWQESGFLLAMDEANPIPVKWAMARMGLCGGALRLPMTPLSPANEAVVEAALRASGLLA